MRKPSSVLMATALATLVSAGIVGGILAANDPAVWKRGATTGDQQTTSAQGASPVNYGPFRVIPSDHPEAEVFWRKGTPEPRVPLTVGSTVEETRRVIPQFKEPGFLPAGLSLASIEAVKAPDQYYVEAVYAAGDLRINISQRSVRMLPIPVLKPAFHPYEELQLGTLDSLPAILRVPKVGVAPRNPKAVRWVKDGIEFHVTGYGFGSLAIVKRVASSLR